MLFVHGGGVAGWMWDKQVQYFTNYHCIVPDLPEQGQASVPNSIFSIDYSARELIQLIEHKGQGKPIIVIGFSLGAQIIIQMLSMKPDLIDYAIINSASVRPIRFIETWIKPSVKLTFLLIKNRLFSKMQAKALYISDDDFETYYAYSQTMKADSLVRILHESMTYHLPEGFAKAKGQLLVTVGGKERGTMLKSMHEIVSSNSNCTGVIIPNVGHGVSLAEPDWFNAFVDNWIRSGELPTEVEVVTSSYCRP